MRFFTLENRVLNTSMGHAYHQFPCHGRCARAYLSCTRSWCHLHCDNDTAVWNGQRASMNLHLSACPGTDSYLQFKYDFLTLPWPCSVWHKREVLHTSLRIAMSPLWFHPAIMPIKIWLHCKWILDTAPLPRDLQKTFVLNGPLSGHYIYINRGGQWQSQCHWPILPRTTASLVTSIQYFLFWILCWCPN